MGFSVLPLHAVGLWCAAFCLAEYLDEVTACAKSCFIADRGNGLVSFP